MQDLGLSDKLKICLQECLLILNDNNLESSPVSDSIQEALWRLSQPMQLAIIGKISSSKSTLVNALLGSDVVRTGQMEETFNVSWLKYGETDKDIKVVFKNGETRYVPRNEWAYWTSHQHDNIFKEQVKYIEVSYNDEILKKINIIDTPGLDALSEIDSKNTVAFLKEVRPDAVIMLFTKSIAESTFSILQDFQNAGTSNFTLTPLNAIGVLAKVDTMWSVMNPDKDILEDAKRVIDTILYGKYPEVKRALFSILPVSSLLGFASSTITDGDMEVLRAFSRTDKGDIYEMLSSPALLVDESYVTEVSIDERMALYRKFGLYGIYLIMETLWKNPLCSLDEIRMVLNCRSGYDKMLSTVIAHFGDRAALIKSQNAIVSVIDACMEVLSVCNGQKYELIENITKKITSMLLSIHEFQEWRFLSDIYEHPDAYDEKEAEEFKAVCGEYGGSAADRLNMLSGASVEDMIAKVKDRALYFRKNYNLYSNIDPKKSALYKVMLSSYNLLLKRIEEAYDQTLEAESMLKSARNFLFGSGAKYN